MSAATATTLTSAAVPHLARDGTDFGTPNAHTTRTSAISSKKSNANAAHHMVGEKDMREL